VAGLEAGPKAVAGLEVGLEVDVVLSTAEADLVVEAGRTAVRVKSQGIGKAALTAERVIWSSLAKTSKPNYKNKWRTRSFPMKCGAPMECITDPLTVCRADHHRCSLLSPCTPTSQWDRGLEASGLTTEGPGCLGSAGDRLPDGKIRLRDLLEEGLTTTVTAPRMDPTWARALLCEADPDLSEEGVRTTHLITDP